MSSIYVVHTLAASGMIVAQVMRVRFPLYNPIGQLAEFGL